MEMRQARATKLTAKRMKEIRGGSRPTSIRTAIMAWALGFRIVEHRGASWSIAADSGEFAKRDSD